MIGPKNVIVVASGAMDATELRKLGALVLETTDAALLVKHLRSALTDPCPPTALELQRERRIWGRR